MDTWAASKSWLLLIVLQWAQGYLCSFKLVFWVSSDIFPEVGLLGWKEDPFLIFWGISILLSTVATPMYIPTNSAKVFPFFHTLTSTCLLIFDDSHSDRCEMISHWGFNFCFSDDWWHWASFHMSIGHLCVLFGEVSIQVLCPFFNWVVWVFLVLSFLSSL